MAHQQPLASIDRNRQNVQEPTGEKPAPAFAQEARQHQTLHSKLMRQEQSGKQNGQYVSPSDDILSPASAKLNAFKEKRFTKSAKPRVLFGKPSSTLELEEPINAKEEA